MGSKVDDLKARLAAVDAKIEADRQTRKTSPERKRDVLGGVPSAPPAVRKGEDTMGSRGFQVQRVMSLLSKDPIIPPERCTVELDVSTRLREEMVLRNEFKCAPGARYMAPLSTEYLRGEGVDNGLMNEVKSLMVAGTEKADPDEMVWSIQKSMGWDKKTAQSWIDDTLGGTLVAPPEFGDLIQLLRNKDALINAGARIVPLPPSGRLRMPRQTAPTVGFMIGENSPITPSNFNTGTLNLSGKKGAIILTLPNELIRFASPATEAITRADMTKSLSLLADYQLLYGEGSDNSPLGLALTPSTATVTPTTVGSNGNTLSPQDLLLFPSAVMANNGEFQGFIMRPELFFDFVQARAAVYNGSTTVPQGQFVYDQFRQLGQGFPMMMAGFKATVTPQVSITRIKGASTNLTTVFGGQWDDFIIAMFGAIEFAQAEQGDTVFSQDQTSVRAILTFDGAARHPGVFAIADSLTLSVGA